MCCASIAVRGECVFCIQMYAQLWVGPWHDDPQDWVTPFLSYVSQNFTHPGDSSSPQCNPLSTVYRQAEENIPHKGQWGEVGGGHPWPGGSMAPELLSFSVHSSWMMHGWLEFGTMWGKRANEHWSGVLQLRWPQLVPPNRCPLCRKWPWCVCVCVWVCLWRENFVTAAFEFFFLLLELRSFINFHVQRKIHESSTWTIYTKSVISALWKNVCTHACILSNSRNKVW